VAGLSFVSIEPRSARRIRLLFDKNLAVGAFTSTAFYTVDCVDGAGVDPAVSAALAVPNVPFAVELALADDLAPGGSYTVSAVAVPAADATTTAPGSTLPLFQAERPPGPVADVSPDALATFIFGADPTFQQDFLETADGDLARVSGQENAKAALVRAMVSDGLCHDPTYGAHPREYVDGPAGTIGTFPGKVQKALLRDDRVKRARVVIEDADQSNPDRAIINSQVELIGGVRVDARNTVKAG
jgi:hypothetical protein